jgi:hypothetical protein
MASPAAGLLARQLKQMQSDKDIPGISCGLKDDNVFEWEVMLMIDDDCKYYGGEPSLPLLPLGCSLHLLRYPVRYINTSANNPPLQAVSSAPNSPSPPNTPISHPS